MNNNFVLNSKGQKTIIGFLFLFFFLGLISAAAPVLSTVQPGALEILAPTYTYVQEGLDKDIYWHVFNTTNLLTNKTASCYYHLYSQNKKGEHIVTANNVITFSNGRDYEVEVKGGNFTVGEYCHIIECNTTTQAGGLERCFTVVSSTSLPIITNTQNPNFFWMILLISGGVIILGFVIKNAPITILGAMGTSFLGLYIIRFGINGIKDNTYTWVVGLIVLVVSIYIMVKSAYEMIEEGL